MTRTSFVLAGLAFVLLWPSPLHLGAQDPIQPTGAPLVVRGPVLTLDPAQPRATLVVVRRGLIERVADVETEEDVPAEGGRVLTVPPGGVAMPGIIESHAHFLGVGQARRRIDLVGSATPQDAAERVRKAAETTPAGKFIVGRGWNQELWPDRAFPDRAVLDAVCGDHPVVLTRVDGHAVWVNSTVLSSAGINDQTPSPSGGEIVKDASGRPTGVLVDNAMDLVTRLVPRTQDPAELVEDFLAAQQAALENGITTFVDAGTSEAALGVLNTLYRSGQMKIRQHVMLSVDDERSLDAILERPPILSIYDDRVSMRSLKIYADGALGSRGAWLIEPYADRPDHAGLAVSDPAFIETAAKRALRRGWQVCVHAIGDRAVRETLNAIERAYAAVEPGERLDPRFRIEHAQIIDPQDVPRFRKLGIYPSMQSCHCTSDAPWVPARLGEMRTAERAYPWRALLDTGCVIPNGTDAPVEPLSPWANLFAAVTRFVQQPDGTALAFHPRQRMNRQEALESLTVWGAIGIFAENRRGRLRPGFQGDLVILDRDPSTCSAWDLPKIRVLATVIAGEVVFE